MRRVAITMTALVLGVAAALGISACGRDDDAATQATQTKATTQADTTTNGNAGGGGSNGGAGGEPTATTSDEGESATGDLARSCGKGEIYSGVTGTCVKRRSGDNPCPKGQEPVVGQKVDACVAKGT